jgi:hypothetical protein
MDELPQVLQKEIWEYVRGDRAHWKQQFKQTIDLINRNKILRISRCINAPPGHFYVVCGDLFGWGYPFHVMDLYIGHDGTSYMSLIECAMNLKEALKIYHKLRRRHKS